VELLTRYTTADIVLEIGGQYERDSGINESIPRVSSSSSSSSAYLF